jgi:hypothetical protein
MESIVELLAPDGWICEVVRSGSSAFSPAAWKPSRSAALGGTRPPSAGMQVYAFATPQEAMMAAYRERLQREVLHRQVEARRGRRG